MVIIELYEIKFKLVTNSGVHTLYSSCKRHYIYSDLGYDTFHMPAIIGLDVVQTNSKTLHDSLKCQIIDDVDDLLNGCFQLSSGFEVVGVDVEFNKSPQKGVTFVQIQRI